MLSKSDQEYIHTKAIKLGLRKPDASKAVFEWCKLNWPEVNVLNIIYDAAEEKVKEKRWFKRVKKEFLRPERLQVIFEHETAFEKLGINKIHQRDSLAYNNILEAFNLIMKNNHKYKTDGLFVYFSSFEKIAKEEAIAQLSQESLISLAKEIDPLRVWTVRKFFGCIVVFLQTVGQVEDSRKSNLQEKIDKVFNEALKPFDEFEYFANSPLKVIFDSKENFENNYAGSWQHYWR